MHGIEKSIGHADYFVSGGSTQPGCISEDLGCSHLKAYRYFIESISSRALFQSRKCQNHEYYTESSLSIFY